MTDFMPILKRFQYDNIFLCALATLPMPVVIEFVEMQAGLREIFHNKITYIQASIKNAI